MEGGERSQRGRERVGLWEVNGRPERSTRPRTSQHVLRLRRALPRALWAGSSEDQDQWGNGGRRAERRRERSPSGPRFKGNRGVDRGREARLTLTSSGWVLDFSFNDEDDFCSGCDIDRRRIDPHPASTVNARYSALLFIPRLIRLNGLSMPAVLIHHNTSESYALHVYTMESGVSRTLVRLTIPRG